MIGIGIIGYGYWGPNLVRNFAEVPEASIVSVSDLNPKRLELVSRRYPSIETTTDLSDLLADSRIDAIAIATPISTHFDLALRALRAGKHVLVEKPLATTSEQALRLLEEATRRNLVLMVDHTFVYTGAVRKIKELVMSQRLGDIYYYDSARINLGLFQHDVNVLWDLAVHDLSIMDYVLSAQPRAVSATGVNHISGEPANIAYLTLFFDGSLIAHIHVNWLSPVKVRRTLIGGNRNMIVYDDLEPSEKVKVYDRGIAVNNNTEKLYDMLIGYRTGDMWSPQLDTTEALRVEANHFIRCIEGSESPITDALAGMRVVEILEAATQSMARRGRLVELELSPGRLPSDSFLGLEVAVP
jgi:predicted dehydrogenase